jgi:hypothetical protein
MMVLYILVVVINMVNKDKVKTQKVMVQIVKINQVMKMKRTSKMVELLMVELKEVMVKRLKPHFREAIYRLL